MKLKLNGENVSVPNTVKTVFNLLQHFELDQKVVIVERNETILDRGTYQEVTLCDGDKVELVHFVGGG